MKPCTNSITNSSKKNRPRSGGSTKSSLRRPYLFKGWLTICSCYSPRRRPSDAWLSRTHRRSLVSAFYTAMRQDSPDSCTGKMEHHKETDKSLERVLTPFFPFLFSASFPVSWKCTTRLKDAQSLDSSSGNRFDPPTNRWLRGEV